MKEKTLLKIALICSLVGLAALFLASRNFDVRDYGNSPTQLNRNLGEEVKLKGTVDRITKKNDVIFIQVNQNNPVSVVLFKGNGALDLNQGDYIEILGTVRDYRGKNEIVADSIRLLIKR